MKKEEKKFSFKKALVLFGIITIVVIFALYEKKDYCNPEKYTVTGTTADKFLNDWFNSFGGEFHCLDSREDANLVSGKINYIICGIKPQESGEYTVEITKANARINKPAEIESWFADRKWTGNAIADAITKSSIEVDVPESRESEALNLEIVLRKNNQLVATETLYFKVIEKDISKESIC